MAFDVEDQEQGELIDAMYETRGDTFEEALQAWTVEEALMCDEICNGVPHRVFLDLNKHDKSLKLANVFDKLEDETKTQVKLIYDNYED